MPQPLQVITYRSPVPGPRLLVLGAVHGHEICGTLGLSRLRTELDGGIFGLHAGTLTLMPLCNPLAYAAGKRYVVEDLNRILRHHSSPQHDEQHFANQIADQIDACDVLLDLHSATTGHGPSLFLDYPTVNNIALAKAVGIADWIVGWARLFANTPGVSEDDTQGYANANGKRALFVECGQHAEPEAPHRAYVFARRVLDHLEMIPYAQPAEATASPRIAQMSQVVLRDKPGRFASAWQHLQPVKAGTVIIEYDDGDVYQVPVDSILVLPKDYAKPGQEWIYIANESSLKDLAPLGT